MRNLGVFPKIMKSDTIYRSLAEELNILKEKQQFRILRHTRRRSSTEVAYQNSHCLNLSSNDYLGLGANRQLHHEFFELISDENLLDEFGMSSSSSRLLTGNSRMYTGLEHELAALYHREAACVFNSGYHANIGILPALTSRHDLVLSDKLNHASIIDGLKLSDAKFLRYRHRDYEHLERLLHTHREAYRRMIIITETVFSMDGDIADLQRLVELKNRYDALLIVDEAHAVGVFGTSGCGLCEEQGVIREIDIIVGTFGKALASLGAFAVSSTLVKEYLVNTMRSLIFTTALPPIVLHWNRFILQKVAEMSAKRRQLRELGAKLRRELHAHDFQTPGESQIVPVILGENRVASHVAEFLQRRGFLVFAIRPPTVPPNTARLRISLNPDISWQHIEQLPALIGECVYANTMASPS